MIVAHIGGVPFEEVAASFAPIAGAVCLALIVTLRESTHRRSEPISRSEPER